MPPEPASQGLDALDQRAERQRERRHRTPPPPKRTLPPEGNDEQQDAARENADQGAEQATDEQQAASAPTRPARKQSSGRKASGKRSERKAKPKGPTIPQPDPQHRVEWNLYARQVRAGLMAWVSARAKVEARAADVRELLGAAGEQVTPADLANIVYDVANRTGTDVTDVATATGIPLENPSSPPAQD